MSSRAYSFLRKLVLLSMSVIIIAATSACSSVGSGSSASPPGTGGSVPGEGRDASSRLGTTAIWASVSAGWNYGCRVETDGTIACWGSNDYGQATPPAGTFFSASAGFNHTCGVRTDGTVACWGNNDYGQATPPADTSDASDAGLLSGDGNHQ